MSVPSIGNLESLFNSPDAARQAAIAQSNAVYEQQAYRLAEQSSLIKLKSRGVVPEVRSIADSSQVAAIRATNRAADFAYESELLKRQGRLGGGGSTPITNPTGSGIPGGGATIAGGVPETLPQSPATIAPAAPRSALGVPGLSPSAVRLGAIGAGLDFGTRLIAGQSPAQATVGTLGSVAGGIAGAALGSAFGPGGTFLSSVLGAQLGGMLADRLFNALNPPSVPRSALPVAPFQGGQSQNIGYQVSMREQRRDRPDVVFGGQVLGAVVGIVSETLTLPNSEPVLQWYLVSGSGTVRTFLGSSSATGGQSFSIISINRVDGQPDVGGNPAPVANPNAPPRPALARPSAPYSPAAPSRVPNAVPLNAPNLINPQTGARIAPNTGTDTASRPSTAPATTPNPFSPASTIAPRITPEQLKRVAPNPITPEANPAIAARPQTGVSNRPGDWGVQLGQEGLYGETPAEYWHRNSSPTSSNPGSSAQPSTTPGLLPVGAAGIGLLLGGLTAANFGPSRTSRITTPAAAPDTSAPTAPATGGGNQPGFCRFRDDPHSPTINQRTGRMEQVDLAIQAYQTTMLTQLDNKMGAQLPNGGVAGKLGRMAGLASKTWNFLQIDRALAVFTWIGVLHNAYMLSNNLGQTLFSAISNGLDAIGIQKVDAEGNEEAYDVGEIVAKYTDNFAKGVFGTSTWEGIKADWKKLNRIYQAATNLLNSLQSISYAMLEGLETVGNYTAKIGNAARIFGVFTEKAFNPMKDNLNFKGGRFFRFLERTEEFVENIDSIASSVVDIQQTAADCADQKTALTTAVQAFETTKTTEETAKKSSSASPTIAPADQRKPDS